MQLHFIVNVFLVESLRGSVELWSPRAVAAQFKKE